jgi:peptidoglycan hydrolase-like protein with peptidoglycan-binding domain
MPKPAQREPAEEPEPTAAEVCDPDTPFMLGHPAVETSLELTDCVRGPKGPERVDAPPLSDALVLLVQHHLLDLGFDPGPIDGLIGPRTRAAVRTFASAQGLDSGERIDFALLRALTQTPPGAADPAEAMPEANR